jgi:lipoprotein-releasing system ATP-binding protein
MSESGRGALLAARGLGRSFVSGGRILRVLHGLDLDVRRGEMVAICGQSGVGKSTLLHILGALDRADEGSYLFSGRDLMAHDAAERARFRTQEVGFVFQFHNLLPEFTALENVMLAGLIGRAGVPGTRARAAALLADLGVAERADHLPSRLSGGEQQRVAIARALMSAGSLLLADEPTGNLDPETAGRVFDLMRRLQQERGLAVVMATHNGSLAARCDRVLLLRDGVLTARAGAGEEMAPAYPTG